MDLQALVCYAHWWLWCVTDFLSRDGTNLTSLPHSALLSPHHITHSILAAKTQGAVWTYNQGVILSGLTRYATIFNDPTTLTYAANLAVTASKYFGGGTSRGDVLIETACGGECWQLHANRYSSLLFASQPVLDSVA